MLTLLINWLMLTPLPLMNELPVDDNNVLLWFFLIVDGFLVKDLLSLKLLALVELFKILDVFYLDFYVVALLVIIDSYVLSFKPSILSSKFSFAMRALSLMVLSILAKSP